MVANRDHCFIPSCIRWKSAVAKLPKRHMDYHTKLSGSAGLVPAPHFAQKGSIAPKIIWTLSPFTPDFKFQYYSTLVEGGGADWLQAGSPCLQLSARCSTVVPRRRTLPASRHRSSMSSAFCLGIVTDCPSYAAVNRRWPSFSGRRPSYLEQSSASRHVSTVTGHLSQSPQDSSLQALLSMTSPFSCRAREVTCHYGHVNRFCYLLTLQICCCENFWQIFCISNFVLETAAEQWSSVGWRASL